MKIAALADLHGFFPEVPDCDVVVVAGDIVNWNPGLPDWQMGFYCKEQIKQFRDWLNALNMRGIVVVGCAGNHDFAFAETDVARKINWHYLEDEGTEIGGLKFWGSPWQPWMAGWAFNSPESDLDDDAEPFMASKFEQIPDDTDILITHSPPAGFHDTVRGAHKGSLALNRAVERVQPKLHIFGHVHKPGVEVVEQTVLCNAAYVGFNRQPNGHPIQVFEI